MKREKLLATCLASSLLLNACSAKESSPTTNQGAADAASADPDVEAESKQDLAAGMEHCLDTAGTKCFIQFLDEGRQRFLATEDAEKELLLSGVLPDNVNLEKIDSISYNYITSASVIPRTTYETGARVIVDVVAEDGTAKMLPGRDNSANAKLPLPVKIPAFFTKLKPGALGPILKPAGGAGFTGKLARLKGKIKLGWPKAKANGKKGISGLWQIIFGASGILTIAGVGTGIASFFGAGAPAKNGNSNGALSQPEFSFDLGEGVTVSGENE